MIGVGTLVQVTNGYGINIGIKKVIGIDDEGRYYLSPTDSPWFSWQESDLKPVTENKPERNK